MTERKISRRSALGMIGKTGAALGAGTCFFLSLKTSPLAASDMKRGPGRAGPPAGAEKVVISGTGSVLTARISGAPGRQFAFVCATTDARDAYKALAKAQGRLNERGQGILRIDAKSLPEGKVFLRVVTANSTSFDQDVAGTEAFVVKVSKGLITGYEGLVSRPVISTGGDQAVASFAAACIAVKRK
jgi:hypothetical protein